MSVFDHQNIVVGACRVGKVVTEGASIAVLNADAAAGASTIVLTGLTLGVKVGDVIEVKDSANSEFVIVTLVTEATNTTLTLLHKLLHSYTTAATATAYKATRTLWGLTEEDSLTFSSDMDVVEIMADQVMGPVKRVLVGVARRLATSFQEVTPATMSDLQGMSTDPVGTWPEQTLVVGYADDVPEINIMITGPAPGGNYFRYTFFGRVIDVGDTVRGKRTAVVIPVTFGEIVNADTNEFGVFAFSATEFS